MPCSSIREHPSLKQKYILEPKLREMKGDTAADDSTAKD
jgi:hypothetical protein